MPPLTKPALTLGIVVSLFLTTMSISILVSPRGTDLAKERQSQEELSARIEQRILLTKEILEQSNTTDPNYPYAKEMMDKAKHSLQVWRQTRNRMDSGMLDNDDYNRVVIDIANLCRLCCHALEKVKQGEPPTPPTQTQIANLTHRGWVVRLRVHDWLTARMNAGHITEHDNRLWQTALAAACRATEAELQVLLAQA